MRQIILNFYLFNIFLIIYKIHVMLDACFSLQIRQRGHHNILKYCYNQFMFIDKLQLFYPSRIIIMVCLLLDLTTILPDSQICIKFVNNNQMTSENQFEVHSCSQLMKYAVGDSFKDSQSTSKFYQSQLLLRFFSSGRATVLLFKKQLAGIDQDYSIKQMDSPLCFTSFTRYRRLYLAYTNRNQVIICQFQKKEQGEYLSGKEIAKYEYKFAKGDGFRTFSTPIDLMDGQAIIGYSNKGELYLINFSYHNKIAECRVAQIQNLDKAVGLWSWLSFQKQVQYKDVNLITFLSGSSNALISILAIRDNTASILEVRKIQRSNQFTVKLAYECQQFSKILPKQSIFLSYLKTQDNQIFVAYSHKGKILLIKFYISDNDLTLLCYNYKTNIPADEFQMIKCKQKLYLSFRNKEKKNYNCLKIGLINFDHNQSTDFLQKQFFIQTSSPLKLCGNQNELYFFCDHLFYVIQKDHANYDHESIMKIKLQSFQASLNRGVGRYIRKNIQQSNYQQLQLNFKEKEERIKEQLEHLQKQGINQTLHKLINQKLLCNKLVNIIISNKNFGKAAIQLQSKQTKHQLRQIQQQQLLTNCLLKQQPKYIRLLLSQIGDIAHPIGSIEYLNSILEKILDFPQQLRDHQDLLQEILSQPCSEAIHIAARKYSNLDEIKLLIDYTFKLISPSEQAFIEDFEIIVQRFNQTVFIRNHIINFTLKQAFCQLFVFTNKKIFSESDVKDIISRLNKKQRVPYLSEFFVKLKQQYISINDESEEKLLMKEKIKMLIRVLQPYYEQVESILQKTFPGLCVYHYLKSDKRRSYDQEINQAIVKCKAPLPAYLLKLSLPNKDIKQWKQQLLEIKKSKTIKIEPSIIPKLIGIQKIKQEAKINQIAI